MVFTLPGPKSWPESEREISVEETASWYTPIQACAYAARIFGTKAAPNAIWQRLVAGLIETAANSSSLTVRDRAPLTDFKPGLIPPRFWKHLSETGSDLWGAGDVRFFIRRFRDGKSATYQCFGVRLNPRFVHETLPPLPPAPPAEEHEAPSPVSQVNKGGRPRKDWWDDFWIDICGQIYEGNLKPQRQADLEKAMLDWAINHGYDLSEATARKAAKKLFSAWKLGG
jgi:hypothetical protein